MFGQCAHSALLRALLLAFCVQAYYSTVIASTLRHASYAASEPSFHYDSSGTKRVYYLGVDEVEWDYAPSGKNLCYGRPFNDDELVFTEKSSERIGTVYRKAVFREYTDETFKIKAERTAAWRHLGLLGPAIHAEVGDTLVIVVHNGASIPVTFVLDGVAVDEANPKVIRPGEVKTFKFGVQENSGPSASSYSSSTMYLYRSNSNGPSDVYAGLLGPLIVTRKGEAMTDGRPKDVMHEIVTVLWVSDENSSPYWDLENKRRLGRGKRNGSKPKISSSARHFAEEEADSTGMNEEEEEEEEEEEDENADAELEESNLMHVINGLIYCNLEGLEMEVGKKTRWYVAAVGNEVDVHSMHWHGLVGTTAGGAHVDAVRLLPYSTLPVDFEADNPAEAWLVHCHVNDHLQAGMMALMKVRGEKVQSAFPSGPRRTREYFIQAEDEIWDYAPKGTDVCDSRQFGKDEEIFVKSQLPILDDEDRVLGYGIGSKYKKTRYVQYKDKAFTQKVYRDKHWEHLGLMGPVLRVRVGEEIRVHFRNKASVKLSMHSHGLFYLKDSEGAPYNDSTTEGEKKDDVVNPGAEVTYLWQASERAGPGPSEVSETKLWIYHSHKDEIIDTYTGLFGVVLVIRSDATNYDDESLMPLDGTKELILHFSVMNELKSAHSRKNVLIPKGNRKLKESEIELLLENESFDESNLMHAINGFVYCNGPIVSLQENKVVRVYMYSLGTEVDVHTPMFATEVLRLDVGSAHGSENLLAGTFSSAVISPLHTGKLELRCNVNDHVVAGMRALYNVSGDCENNPSNEAVQPSIRHYIAAEEIPWDYTPIERDMCRNKPFDDDAQVFTKAGLHRPGSKYIKAVYREYEDGSFRKRKRENHHGFSGIVGPLLHFEVGETVEIVFYNKLKMKANLKIVGLQLLHKCDAGAEKDRDEYEELENGVSPGARVTYRFQVPEVASAFHTELSSVPFVYYSSVDTIAHTSAGLVGVIAVTRRNELNKHTRLPHDTKAAYPLSLNIFRENESPYIAESLRKFAKGNTTSEEIEELQDDDDWVESNAMHSINGYLYCNNPRLKAHEESVVRFYVFGFGSESSMHNPVFHGQIIHNRLYQGSSAAGVAILPFNAVPVDVVMASNGRWTIECGVADHTLAGMQAGLEVINCPEYSEQ